VPTALKIVDFRFLLAGNLISNLGSSLLVVALPFQVFRLTGSTAATGLTLAAESLPALFVGPVGGVFVDRWDRRRLMIVTDLLRVVAVAGILLADRPDRLVWLYLALIAEDLGGVFFRPAARALVPTVVGTGQELVSANSLMAVNNGIVRLVGAPLGGVLLSLFGLPVLVLLDAASYLVSALMITLTSRRAMPTGVGRIGAVLAELGAGLRFVGRHATLRGLLLVSITFFTANAVFTALLIPFMTIRFGNHPEVIGYLLSALGVGYLVGGPLAGRLVRRRSAGVLLVLAQAGVGLCFMALANAPTAAVAVLAGGLAGLPGSLLMVTVQTTLQRATPDPLRGRTGATFFAGDALAALVGALIGTTCGAPAHLPLVLTVTAATILLAATLVPTILPTRAAASVRQR
jgi:predicted MFS family arabinose efflux permease